MRIKSRYTVLEKEINLIVDSDIRKWVRATLANVPNYFYVAQASSSGKYHPACTNKVGGLVTHVKRAVYIAYRLCSGWGIKGIQQDIVVAATILHDIAKVPSTKVMHLYGMVVTDKDFVNHPINAEKYFAPIEIDLPIYEIGTQKPIDVARENNPYWLELITNCIRYHMGLWTPDSINKPLTKYTLPELCVYTADYIATTKSLITPEDEV